MSSSWYQRPLRWAFYLTLVGFVGCATSESDTWTPLFNGTDLAGWKVYQGPREANAPGDYNGWIAVDSVLVFDPARRTTPAPASIITEKSYTNFELSLEWMVDPQTNSGVLFGIQDSPEFEQLYHTGVEIQVLDDEWTDYIEQRGDINRAASLYNLMPPSALAAKPTGAWNHYLLHVDHKLNEGFLVFNGVEVLRFPVHGPEWEALVADSGFADWPGFGRFQTGQIGLQEHGGMVAYRRIKIKELPE